MNNNNTKLFALLFFSSQTISILGVWPFDNHIGKKGIEDLAKLQAIIKKDVQEVVQDVVQNQVQQFTSNAAKGAFEQFTSEKQLEIGANIAQGIFDKFTPQKQAEIGATLGASFGDEFGKHVVEGIATGVTGLAAASGKAIAAKASATVTATKVAAMGTATSAKATIVAGLASPAAPFVIGGVVIGGAAVGGGYGAYKYRENNFRRCINRNFGGQLNAEGFPERCESPERRLAWWSKYASDEIVGRYKVERSGLVTKGAGHTE